MIFVSISFEWMSECVFWTGCDTFQFFKGGGILVKLLSLIVFVNECERDEMKMIEHTVESNVLRFRKRFRTLATSRVDIPIFSWCRNCTG